MSLTIPKGFTKEYYIVENEGNYVNSNFRGDLYLYITYEPHDTFKRDGSDLYYSLAIKLLDSLLGSTVSIPLLDSEVQIKLPVNCQTGKVLRLLNKGLPKYDSPLKGNLYVQIVLELPANLSDSDKDSLLKIGTNWLTGSLND